MAWLTDNPRFVRKVQKYLRRFPYVSWDRFVYYKTGSGKRAVSIYGWIKRPDTHEDFLIFDIKEDGSMSYQTSSKAWSLKIYKKLNGDGYGHQNCKRVEHFFPVRNAIRLKK